MKKIESIFLILISILLITSCANKKQEVDFENLQYEKNIESVSNIFKDLNSIDKVYFKSTQVGATSGIGPSTFKNAGFICISEDEMNSLRSKFSFEDAEPSFPSGISADITGKDRFHWQSNNDFSRELLKGNYIGDVYIDIQNNIIFFDIENT